MGQRIDQFCENLRQKLTVTDSGLDGLKAKIEGKATHVEQDVQSHLDKLHKRIEQERAKVSAAQADIKNWAEQRKAVTSDKIVEWKSKWETGKLQSRADDAERYAAAAINVAVAAVGGAQPAPPGTWLGRPAAGPPPAQ